MSLNLPHELGFGTPDVGSIASGLQFEPPMKVPEQIGYIIATATLIGSDPEVTGSTCVRLSSAQYNRAGRTALKVHGFDLPRFNQLESDAAQRHVSLDQPEIVVETYRSRSTLGSIMLLGVYSSSDLAMYARRKSNLGRY